MGNYKKLDVWKLGIKLCKDIYLTTNKFPNNEIYGLTSQLRRASISVPSNIAEGAGRSTNKDFRKFLYNSMGSLKEIETQLIIAKELRYISENEFYIISIKMNFIIGKLTNFIKIISKEC